MRLEDLLVFGGSCLVVVFCFCWCSYQDKKEEEKYQEQLKELFIPTQQADVDVAKEQVIEKIKNKYNVELSKENLNPVENINALDFLKKNGFVKEEENKYGDTIFVKGNDGEDINYILKSKYKPRVDKFNDFNFTTEQFLYLLETKQILLAPISHYNEFEICVEPYFSFKPYCDIKTTPFNYVNINGNDLSSNGINFEIKYDSDIKNSKKQMKVYKHMELRCGVLVDKKYLIYMIDKILSDETLKYKLNTNYIVHYLNIPPGINKQDINKLINEVGKKNEIDNLVNRFELIDDDFVSLRYLNRDNPDYLKWLDEEQKEMIVND